MWTIKGIAMSEKRGRRLSRVNEFKLYKKLEAMKTHIFKDKPTAVEVARVISEDLKFEVSQRVVLAAFKTVWPDHKWPGRSQETRPGGWIYNRMKRQEQLMNLLIETVRKGLSTPDVVQLRRWKLSLWRMGFMIWISGSWWPVAL